MNRKTSCMRLLYSFLAVTLLVMLACSPPPEPLDTKRSTIVRSLENAVFEANEVVYSDTVPPELVCAERGHVASGVSSVTLMGWSPRLVDTDSGSMLIIYDPNIRTLHCMRCGEEWKEPVMSGPDTAFITPMRGDTVGRFLIRQ